MHEHRYYGASQPFGDWSTPNLKWLNTTQALADIAFFIDEMNTQMSGTHKWIIVGGSYPGAMSAFFKSKYDSHVVASWSSSGVIDAVYDFKDFDMDIMYSTSNSSLLCAQKMLFVTDLID